jgi:hypothetical protein
MVVPVLHILAVQLMIQAKVVAVVEQALLEQPELVPAQVMVVTA